MEIEEIVKLNYSINRLFDSFKGTFPKKDIFTKSEFIDAYTLAYNICIKNDDEVDYSRILYDFQNKKLDEYNEILNIRIVNSKSIIEDTRGTENAVTWKAIRIRFGGKDGKGGLLKRMSAMNKQMHGLPPEEFEFRDEDEIREWSEEENVAIFQKIIDIFQHLFHLL